MALLLGSATSNPANPPGWYNVKDYGAVGDNATDDTTAIQNAVNALKAAVNSATSSMGGQTLYFPPGYYKVTSTLDFTSMAEVRILGGAGRGGWGKLAADGNPPTVIAVNHGNASTAAGVNMAMSTGCVWDGVSVISRGGSYNGNLLNFDSTSATDVFGNRVQNCILRGFTGAAALLALAGNIEFSADNVTFQDGTSTGPQVRMVNPSGAATWSNANSFRSCSFIGQRQYSVLNPGPQTTLLDCTFEPTSGSVPAPIAYTALGNEAASVLSLVGCGFWDNTGTGTGSAWLTASVATSAFHIAGCLFSLSPSGNAINLSSHTGLSISGCRFQAAAAGTPSIFNPSSVVASGAWNGNYAPSPVVDNHGTVFV